MNTVPLNTSMDAARKEFLKEFGESYGYRNAPKNIDDIRATEFKRLDGNVYLDHAGATLYSELQMEAIFKDLTTTVYGNPHSQSSSSLTSSDIVEDARHQVLKICNASPKEYKCIFTSGATAALKLVGEAFSWSNESTFMYTIENHNSVLGIREYALNEGAEALAIDFEENKKIDSYGNTKSPIKVSQYSIPKRSEARVLEKEPTGHTYNLFSFPTECNFSGARFNLDLIDLIKEDTERVLEGSQQSRGCWMVLLCDLFTGDVGWFCLMLQKDVLQTLQIYQSIRRILLSFHFTRKADGERVPQVQLQSPAKQRFCYER